MSLTRTLTLLVTSTVLLMALIAATWSYVESNHELEELFDAELAQSTRIVQGLVRHLADSQSMDQLPKTLSETLELQLSESDNIDFEAGNNEILPRGIGHKYEKNWLSKFGRPTSLPCWTPSKRMIPKG
jgi:two-component system sensor histidine kinase QseC